MNNFFRPDGGGAGGLTPEQEQLLEKSSFANIDDAANGAVFAAGDSFRDGFATYIVKSGQTWTKGTDPIEEGTKLSKQIIETYNKFIQGEFIDKIESNYSFVSATKRIIDNDVTGKLEFLQEENKTIEISGTTDNNGTYTIVSVIGTNEIEVLEALVDETSDGLIVHTLVGEGIEAWVETNGSYYLREAFSVNNIEFGSINVRFFGELGDVEDQGFIKSEVGGATINIVERTIDGIEQDTIQLLDDASGICSVHEILSSLHWGFIDSFGVSYSGLSELDEVDGDEGYFTGLQDDVRDKRYGMNFNSNNGKLRLNQTDSGPFDITFDGLNGRQNIDFFESVDWEVVVPENVQPATVYVNKKELEDKLTFRTNAGGGGTKIIVGSGSSSGTNRVSYFANFGATIYTETNTKVLSESDLAKNETEITMPSGRRNYTIEFSELVLKDLGSKVSLICQNVGGTVTLKNTGTNKVWLFNGLNEITIDIEKKKEIVFTNISSDKNAFQNFDVIPVETVNIEIKEDGVMERLATGGVITVDKDMTFTFKSQITTSVRFNVVEGATLVIRGTGMYPLLWTGAGVFITSVLAPMHIVNITMIATNGGTLLDLSGNIDTHVVFNFCVLIGWNMGNVYNIPTSPIAPQFYIEYSAFFDWSGGLNCINTADVGITDCTLLQLGGVSANVPFITMNGNIPVGLYAAGTTGVMEAGETFLKIDPQVANSSRIQIAGQSLKGKYFETDGITGAFTAIADAGVSSTNIDSVSDSSGIARFNYTGSNVFVNQEVKISGFAANTAYNEAFSIVATGTGWFEVAVAFGSSETVGSFLSNSVTFAEIGTVLLDGDTLTIMSDNVLAYDGGAIVYNKQTDSFQINRVFSVTDIGTWDTSGIDQTDSRVIASNNPSQPSSRYIGAGFMNENTVTNTAGGNPITNTEYTDIVFGGTGLVKSSNIERWKIIDPILGVFEYTGNEPFSGFIDYRITGVSSGGDLEFRYKWLKDSGSGYANLPDNKYIRNEISTVASNTNDKIPLTAKKGDRIKPQITRMTGSSTHTTTDFSVSIT